VCNSKDNSARSYSNNILQLYFEPKLSALLMRDFKREVCIYIYI